jgi:flagellar motor switch/type III secretory pathway protein FliN
MTDIINELPNMEKAAPELAMAVEQAMPAPPRLDALFSIPVTVELVLSSLKMPVSKLMDIQVGSELDLDHPAGAEVALMVNGSRIAFGHLFLIDTASRRVGVRISRLATSSAEV